MYSRDTDRGNSRGGGRAEKVVRLDERPPARACEVDQLLHPPRLRALPEISPRPSSNGSKLDVCVKRLVAAHSLVR